MNIKNTIIEHYKNFFDLHAKGIALDEDDHLNLDWAEDLVKNCFIPNVSESTLGIPDIRNKLSPITHLITIIEDERFDKEKWLPKALDGAKRSVNYLAQRDVYSR